MNRTQATKRGNGIVAQVAQLLGIPFRRWAREHGHDDRVAEIALKNWVQGKKIYGYKAQIALRELLVQLGFEVNPKDPLPPPTTLKKILPLSIIKKENINGPQ